MARSLRDLLGDAEAASTFDNNLRPRRVASALLRVAASLSLTPVGGWLTRRITAAWYQEGLERERRQGREQLESGAKGLYRDKALLVGHEPVTLFDLFVVDLPRPSYDYLYQSAQAKLLEVELPNDGTATEAALVAVLERMCLLNLNLAERLNAELGYAVEQAAWDYSDAVFLNWVACLRQEARLSKADKLARLLVGDRDSLEEGATEALLDEELKRLLTEQLAETVVVLKALPDMLLTGRELRAESRKSAADAAAGFSKLREQVKANGLKRGLEPKPDIGSLDVSSSSARPSDQRGLDL